MTCGSGQSVRNLRTKQRKHPCPFDLQGLKHSNLLLCLVCASALKYLTSATGSKLFGYWTTASWNIKKNLNVGKVQCQKYIKKAVFVCTLYTQQEPWTERVWSVKLVKCLALQHHIQLTSLFYRNVAKLSINSCLYSTQPVTHKKTPPKEKHYLNLNHLFFCPMAVKWILFFKKTKKIRPLTYFVHLLFANDGHTGVEQWIVVRLHIVSFSFFGNWQQQNVTNEMKEKVMSVSSNSLQFHSLDQAPCLREKGCERSSTIHTFWELDPRPDNANPNNESNTQVC